MQRYQIVTLSALGHLGLVAGLFVAGVWRLERLAIEHARATPLAIAALPAPAPEGGLAAAKVVQTPKLPRATVVHQPTKVPPDPPPAAETATDQGGGLGSGDGTGTGPGSASDSGPCTENCGDAPAEISQCGNGAREAGETCDDGNQRGGDGCSSTCQREAPPVQTVGPSVMDAQWLSGERKIYPSDAVKTQMLRDDRRKSVGLLKVCVDQTGVVSSAGVAKSIGYPAYDDRLVAGALRWRFRPMMVNGRAAPFCGMVTFVYVMQ